MDMSAKIKDESSMDDVTSVEVLQCVDAVRSWCNRISAARQMFLHELMEQDHLGGDKVEAINGLELFSDALSLFQWQVERVGQKILDEARLSTFKRLFTIFLEKLEASENTFAPLLEKLDGLSDRKSVTPHYWSTQATSERDLPTEASHLPLTREFETILQETRREIGRQRASFELFRQVCELLELNDETGFHPTLERAFDEGHTELAQFLVGNLIYNKNSYLLTSSSKGDRRIVRLLLEYGTDVNAQGDGQGSALHAAASEGQDEMVAFLLYKGADINAQGGYYGNALQASSFAGHERIVIHLLCHYADVNAQGGYYGNALQAASHAGHEGIVRLLLGEGVNVNAQGGYYGNALHAASSAGQQVIVQLLLEFGAAVDANGRYGNALHTASYRGHEEIVRILLKSGADVNALKNRGTALQEASSAGYRKIAQLLLEYGADISIRGSRDTALQIASSAGHQEVVRLLLEHGVADNGQGLFRALWGASSNGHKEAMRLLTKFRQDNSIDEGNDHTLVEQIAVWLLENVFFRSLLAKAFEEKIRSETFWEGLAQLIEHYGKDLIKLTSERKLLRIAGCLVFHRWHIIRAMFSRCRSLETNVCKDPGGGQKDRVAASLNNGEVTSDENSDGVNLKLSKDNIDEVKQYLSSKNTPLEFFLGSICRLLYSNPLEAVRVELLRGIKNRSEPCRVRFELSWRIEEYLDKEIVKSRSGKIDRRVFGSLLTLSGDGHQCYANSCEVYMKWRWPRTYNVLLEALALSWEGQTLGMYNHKSYSHFQDHTPTQNLHRSFNNTWIRLFLT